MGMILTEAQRPHVGEFHYRRVLEISGARDPILLANLAWNLKCQGRIAEARELYNESIKAAPDIFQTLFGWGQLEEADGNFAAAREKLDRAAEIRPDDPGLRVARATLHAREGKLAAALAELEPDPGDDESGPSAELVRTPTHFSRRAGFSTGWGVMMRPSLLSTRRSDWRAKSPESAISITRRGRSPIACGSSSSAIACG